MKGTGKRFLFFSKQKQISKNVLIENPKTQNKNESNLNLSNKKSQLKVKLHTRISIKSKISYPDLKNGKKKKLPVLDPTIRVVDVWPNSFFLCLLFRWSKSGQGTNNRQPWIFLLGPYEIYLFLSFSLFLLFSSPCSKFFLLS